MAVSEVAPLERVPPNDIAAERGVLGAVLLNNEVLVHTTDLLVETDFYRTGHQLIYKSMLELEEQATPVDTITLSERLRAKNELDKVGGVAYLAELTSEVPSVAHARHYAGIVRKLAVLRHLIWVSTEIASEGYTAGADIEDFLDKAERDIFGVTERQVKSAFVPVKDTLQDAFDKIEELYHAKESITGVPSGFHKLDELTAGFQPSDLIIIAGRPGMGKTAFILNIAQNAAIQARVPTAFFSLEMSKEQLVQRMLCSEAKVDSQRVRKGRLKDADWPKLTRAAGVLTDAPIFIDDTPAISILEVSAKARRLYAKEKIGLIVVDYLQLMRGRGNHDVREQEISEISRSLKALAKELNIPVVALSQLNRGVESRTDKRPMISDLRESGAIEQDADVIMFIYREAAYLKKDEEMTDEQRTGAEIIIGKQRNGPQGTARLIFIGEHTSFENPAFGYDE